jgi:hypothetical protein
LQHRICYQRFSGGQYFRHSADFLNHSHPSRSRSKACQTAASRL